MSEPKIIQKNLSELLSTLKSQQQQIKETIAKPAVVAWLSLDLKKHLVVLKALGLPVQEISSSKSVCQKEAKLLLSQISKLTSACGELQADIIGVLDQEIASNRAKEIASKHDLLSQEIDNFSSHAHFLIKARQKFNHALTMPNLITVAQLLASKKKDAFKKGLELYTLFFSDPADKDNQNTLSSYKTMEKKLTARFKGLDFSELPNLTEEIFHHQLDISVLVLEKISSFIAAVESRFTSQHSTKKRIEEKLTRLVNQENLLTALTETTNLAKSLCQLLLNLSTKHTISQHVRLIPSTFEHLNVLHLSAKNTLIPQAKADTKSGGAILNPTTLAAKNTKTFFFGLKGVVRSIKLLYSSFKGKQAFNEEELQHLLEKSICTCRLFYSNSNKDIKKMKFFIDDLLKDYARPYPYLPLFKLIKKTIADYGSQAESFIYNFTIDEKYRSLTDEPIPARFGKLLDEINKNHQHFIKLEKALLQTQGYA